jgi:hypothetical protein
VQGLAFIASDVLASVSCLDSDILVHVSSTWTGDIPPELSHLSALPSPFTSHKTVHEVCVTYHHVYTFSLSPYTVKTKDKAVIAAINKARHYIPSALVPVQEGEEEEKAPKPFKIPELKL